MTRKEVQNLIGKLYNEIQYSGWSSHLYRDADWRNLYAIRELCNQVLPTGYKTVCQDVYGYDPNGMTKRYLFTIEHEETGERIIDVAVNAFAAGTVNDVWSAYDTTAIFWAHED